MKLFGFGKKKEDCCSDVIGKELNAGCGCGGTCSIADIEGANIIVLGACCKKSADTFENVKKAVEELNIEEKVVNIGDNVEIAKYGVMQTPALVINSKVVSYGKLITVEEAKKLIEKNMVKL